MCDKSVGERWDGDVMGVPGVALYLPRFVRHLLLHLNLGDRDLCGRRESVCVW